MRVQIPPVQITADKDCSGTPRGLLQVRQPFCGIGMAFFRRVFYSSCLVGSLTLGFMVRGQSANGSDVILAGCEPAYPPYCIVDATGQAGGFSVELLRSVLETMGEKVSFHVDEWAQLRADLATGQIRVLPLVGRTQEREKIYDFTFPYLIMHGTLVVRKDQHDLMDIQDLKGRQVAVLQGDNAEEYVRRANPDAKIVPLPSFEKALVALSNGQYDAVAIQRLVALHLMKKAQLTNLKTMGVTNDQFKQTFCFAVRKGDTELLAKLNEGLSVAMLDGTFRALAIKWFSDSEQIELSSSKIVVSGDKDFPPYEFLDKRGNATGFSVDLTKAIARHMGFEIEFKLGDWSEVRRGLEQETVDLVQSMIFSEMRDKRYDFSPPHSSVQYAVVTRKEMPMRSKLEELAGQKIAVMKSNLMHELAVQQGYETNLIVVATQEQALWALLDGTADYALVGKISAYFWIAKNEWKDIKVSDHSVFSAQCCYAVLPANKAILEQFSEGLAIIKQTGEYRELRNKWLSPYEPRGISLKKGITYLAVVAIPLVTLLLFAIIWSRMLHRQVIERTRDLALEAEGHRAAEIRAQATLDQDITARNKAAEDHKRLMAVIDQVGEGIVITDSVGVVLYVNPAFVETRGYTLEEILGKKLGSIQSGKNDPALYQEMWSIISRGETWVGRFINRRKDGTLYTEESTISPVFDKDDKIMNYVAVSRDITDQLRMAEQLSQSQRLESIGRLAGGVAHDFNNMLGVILGTAEMAMDRTKPEDPIFNDLQEIRRAADRSASLTRRLLTFAHKQTVAPQVVDLNDAVSAALKMLRRLICEDIELLWYPGTEQATVRIDPTQVDQILTNLAVNASDAISGVGQITIKTSHVKLDPEFCKSYANTSPGDYVLLAVSDTGCGMDEKTIKNIFEPFFTTKGVGKGTGLGLPTVYGIVQQNKGFINVYSELGLGTTFKIYLKHFVDTLRVVKEEPLRIVETGGETLLLVEDEEAILQMTETMLKKLGYTVIPANSPSEAIKLAAAFKSNIDLLLTDMVMPQMNGYELSEKLKISRPRMKYLFMSGYTADIISHDKIENDGICFLEKPFSIHDLSVKIREVLS